MLKLKNVKTVRLTLGFSMLFMNSLYEHKFENLVVGLQFLLVLGIDLG